MLKCPENLALRVVLISLTGTRVATCGVRLMDIGLYPVYTRPEAGVVRGNSWCVLLLGLLISVRGKQYLPIFLGDSSEIQGKTLSE